MEFGKNESFCDISGTVFLFYLSGKKRIVYNLNYLWCMICNVGIL